MRAYKLLRRRKDRSLGSLFINRAAAIPINQWLRAQDHPTEGYAHRPGWHCFARPEAPHLSIKEREWFTVEISDYISFKRPENQGGLWYLATWMKILDTTQLSFLE